MHWLKHALLSLSVTFGSAWTSTAFANVETDNSVVAASAKAHENRLLSASDLLARAEEINDAYQASVLAGFQPGQAQTPQQALVALYSAFRTGDPESAALYLDFRFVPESLEDIPPVNVARGLLFIFAQQNVLDLSQVSSDPEALSMTACQTI